MWEIQFRNRLQEINCCDVLIVKNNDEIEYWNIVVHDENVIYAIEIKTGEVLLSLSDDIGTINFAETLENYFINCELLNITKYENLDIIVKVK